MDVTTRPMPVCNVWSSSDFQTLNATKPEQALRCMHAVGFVTNAALQHVPGQSEAGCSTALCTIWAVLRAHLLNTDARLCAIYTSWLPINCMHNSMHSSMHKICDASRFTVSCVLQVCKRSCCNASSAHVSIQADLCNACPVGHLP